MHRATVQAKYNRSLHINKAEQVAKTSRSRPTKQTVLHQPMAIIWMVQPSKPSSQTTLFKVTCHCQAHSSLQCKPSTCLPPETCTLLHYTIKVPTNSCILLFLIIIRQLQQVLWLRLPAVIPAPAAGLAASLPSLL